MKMYFSKKIDNQNIDHKNIETEIIDLISMFLPIINAWKIPHFNTFRISDTYETDYDENYTPAVGAVILAQAIKQGMDYDSLFFEYLKRSSTLLITPGAKPFQQVFLLHYMCLSILMLPADKKEYAIDLVKENIINFCDTCQLFNTNCVALKLVNELFLAQLNIHPIDQTLMNKLLLYLETAQFDSGFINDDMEGEVGFDLHHLDGMPIAYHVFILFVLICGLSYVEFSKSNEVIRNKIEKFVNKGLHWMAYAETDDGNFAMAGRSKYHLFTRGIHCAITAYCGDIPKLNCALQYWRAFLRSDGTYDVTLNHLSHHLRVGYEKYTRVGMYNLLGLAALAVSLDFIQSLMPPNKSIFSININKDLYYDHSSGYAFFHSGRNFMAVNLMNRTVNTQPIIAECFHIRLNGLSMPFAEPFFDRSKTFKLQEVNGQLFEGCVFKREKGDWYIPVFEKAYIYKNSVDEIVLKLENEDCSLIKTIHINDNKFSIFYLVKPKIELLQILQTIPLCMSDGENDLRINKLTEKTINLLFGNLNYQLRCPQSMGGSLLLDRSLKSVSGVSTRFQFIIDAKPKQEETDIQWLWELEYLGESSVELPINNRLDYPDPLLHILEVILEYEKPAHVGSKIKIITKAVGEELEYAWYILEKAKVGYERIHIQWYLKENEFIWEPQKTGTFVVQPFIKDKDQHKISVIWNEIITVE